MVEHTRAALGDKVTAFCQDLTELSLPEPVDAIFSNATFHWIPDHPKLFAALPQRSSPVVSSLPSAVVSETSTPSGPRRRGRPRGVRCILHRLAGALELCARRHHGRAARGCGVRRGRNLARAAADPARRTGAFVRTVCLVRHLDHLPPELHQPFVGLCSRGREPRLPLEYVRLNMVARRAGGAAMTLVSRGAGPCQALPERHGGAEGRLAGDRRR